MITENELERLKQEEWNRITEEIQDSIWELAQTQEASKGLIDLNESGAVPVGAWVKQISGVRGSVSNMDGNIVNLPLRGNFEKGLNNFEYFVAAKAVRKSFADVALKTANSGYLTRRLVDVSQDIITKIRDCETEDGIYVEREIPRQMAFWERLRGRYAHEDIKGKKGKLYVKKGDPIELDISKEIDADESIEKVFVRSPLTCNVAHGVCQVCYGYDNGTGKLIEIGEAAGVTAAQALGEPTTQLTLKSKSDARAGKADVTQGLPRVEELLEVRTPKALALLATTAGKVTLIEGKKKHTIRISADKKEVREINLSESDEVMVEDGDKVKSGASLIVKSDKTILRAPFAGIVKILKTKIKIEADKIVEVEKNFTDMTDLLVKDGQEVTKGQRLTYGSIDPKELADLRSMRDAQQYIVQGVQDVYGIQGLEVDDRHLEIVVRQMSRYGLVTDSGASDNYLPGDYADRLDIEFENIKLLEEEKPIIRYEPVLLGVTNAAIRTESFLSAASFEQQVRVLTDAALIGKVDHLRGLKENVIIGRPVPLGSELKRANSEEIDESLAKAEVLREEEVIDN